jgi:hypothetical protein
MEHAGQISVPAAACQPAGGALLEIREIPAGGTPAGGAMLPAGRTLSQKTVVGKRSNAGFPGATEFWGNVREGRSPPPGVQ